MPTIHGFQDQYIVFSFWVSSNEKIYKSTSKGVPCFCQHSFDIIRHGCECLCGRHIVTSLPSLLFNKMHVSTCLYGFCSNSKSTVWSSSSLHLHYKKNHLYLKTKVNRPQTAFATTGHPILNDPKASAPQSAEQPPAYRAPQTRPGDLQISSHTPWRGHPRRSFLAPLFWDLNDVLISLLCICGLK